jgi:hypothetical protein
MRRVLSIVILLACGQPALAESLLHPAENKVPVAIVRIERTPRFTEIHIETQAPRSKVCWASSGPNSPYLLANGRRHRFIEGDSITSCPATRDYGAHETMIVRFQPRIREFLAGRRRRRRKPVDRPGGVARQLLEFPPGEVAGDRPKPQAPDAQPPDKSPADR